LSNQKNRQKNPEMLAPTRYYVFKISGKTPKIAKNRHLQKAPDSNSGTDHSEVFGCVSSQDVVGSPKKVAEKMRITKSSR